MVLERLRGCRHGPDKATIPQNLGFSPPNPATWINGVADHALSKTDNEAWWIL